MFGECEGREGGIMYVGVTLTCPIYYCQTFQILWTKLSRNQIDLKPFEVGQLHNENNLQMHVTVKILLIADWDCNNEAN